MAVRLAHSAAGRDAEAMSCVDAMEQLHQAATDLSELIQVTDAFNRWWMDVSVPKKNHDKLCLIQRNYSDGYDESLSFLIWLLSHILIRHCRLESLENNIGTLRAERIVRLTLDSVKRGWSEIKAAYLEYKTKVRMQHNCFVEAYPPELTVKKLDRSAARLIPCVTSEFLGVCKCAYGPLAGNCSSVIITTLPLISIFRDYLMSSKGHRQVVTIRCLRIVENILDL